VTTPQAMSTAEPRPRQALAPLQPTELTFSPALQLPPPQAAALVNPPSPHRAVGGWWYCWVAFGGLAETMNL
jgi:hypothetical protein